jgi:hypothetical protein
MQEIFKGWKNETLIKLLSTRKCAWALGEIEMEKQTWGTQYRRQKDSLDIMNQEWNRVQDT